MVNRYRAALAALLEPFILWQNPRARVFSTVDAIYRESFPLILWRSS